MNRPVLVVITSLLLAVACDPKESAKSSGAASPTKHGGALAAKPDSPAAADAATPVRFNSLSECLSSCERADVIPTNRETCRLNCDTAHGATAGSDRTAPGDDGLGRVTSCLGRCYASAKGDAGCVDGCKNLAASATPRLSASVLDGLQSCVSTCHLDNERPTNRETCELNCEQAARVDGTPPPAAP